MTDSVQGRAGDGRGRAGGIGSYAVGDVVLSVYDMPIEIVGVEADRYLGPYEGQWVETAEGRLAPYGAARFIDPPEDSSAGGSSSPARGPDADSDLPEGDGAGDSPPPVTVWERLPYMGLDTVQHFYKDEERGEGELFGWLYRDRIVFDHSSGAWHLWDGNHYKIDRKGRIAVLYCLGVVAQYREAALDADTQRMAYQAEGKTETAEKMAALRDALDRRAAQIQKRARTENALTYATEYRGIDGDEWDNCAGLLPVANGVVELATGQLRAGRPKDYIRTYSPHEWRGLDEPCPRFERFILEIMGGNERMAAFLQRLLGYAISGLVAEHKLPILWGETGRNGKDTLIEAVGHALGPLAGAVTKDVVIDPGGRRYSGAATPHLMELRGRRLVWASEPREGARLDAAQVKLITGGGRLKGRPLYGKEVEWQPTHTAVLITNPRPHAPADDLALWERILLIPFTQRFIDDPKGDNEHVADKQLRAALRGEAAGILAWLARGFLEWQRAGLMPPPEVTEATASYRQAEDTLSLFINECYQIAPEGRVMAQTAYSDYKAWCERWGVNAMQGITFGEKMKARQGWKRTRAGIVYLGISAGGGAVEGF